MNTSMAGNSLARENRLSLWTPLFSLEFLWSQFYAWQSACHGVGGGVCCMPPAFPSDSHLSYPRAKCIYCVSDLTETSIAKSIVSLTVIDSLCTCHCLYKWFFIVLIPCLFCTSSFIVTFSSPTAAICLKICCFSEEYPKVTSKLLWNRHST